MARWATTTGLTPRDLRTVHGGVVVRHVLSRCRILIIMSTRLIAAPARQPANGHQANKCSGGFRRSMSG